MSKRPSAPKWDAKSVLDRLDAEAKKTGLPVEVQLFLDESIEPEQIASMVKSALDKVARQQGANLADIWVGGQRSLSRSIIARAPVAVLRGAVNLGGFVGLLPANPTPSDVRIDPFDVKISKSLGDDERNSD